MNDDFIIKTFFCKNGRLNSNYSTFEYIKTHYDDDVFAYLKNRYDDSESLRETFLRIFFRIDKRPKCIICGKPASWRGKRNKLFSDTCCDKKCINEKRKDTCIEKYGVCNLMNTEESQKKARLVKTERYGDPYYMDREKSKKTCFIKYGRSTPVSEEIIQKRKQTCIEKYGVDVPAKSKIVQDKMKKTCMEKYGVDNYRKSDECLKKIQETKKKNGTINSTKYEKDVYEWLVSEYGKDNIICQYKDDRYKNPKNNHTYHCDFYIKSLDLFIEIQAYWCHGPHPFNPNNKHDIILVNEIKEKIKTKPLYNRYLNEWTNTDVVKRNVAIKNNLRFFECFDRNITKEKFLNIIKNKYDNIQKNNILWYYCE